MELKLEINKEAQQELEKMEWTWPKGMSWEDFNQVSSLHLYLLNPDF